MNLKALYNLVDEIRHLETHPFKDAVTYRLDTSLKLLHSELEYESARLDLEISEAASKELLNYDKN